MIDVVHIISITGNSWVKYMDSVNGFVVMY